MAPLPIYRLGRLARYGCAALIRFCFEITGSRRHHMQDVPVILTGVTGYGSRLPWNFGSVSVPN